MVRLKRIRFTRWCKSLFFKLSAITWYIMKSVLVVFSNNCFLLPENFSIFFTSIIRCFICYVFETIAYPVVVNQDPMIIPIINFFRTEGCKFHSTDFGYGIFAAKLGTYLFCCIFFYYVTLFYYILHNFCLCIQKEKRVSVDLSLSVHD